MFYVLFYHFTSLRPCISQLHDLDLWMSQFCANFFMTTMWPKIGSPSVKVNLCCPILNFFLIQKYGNYWHSCTCHLSFCFMSEQNLSLQWIQNARVIWNVLCYNCFSEIGNWMSCFKMISEEDCLFRMQKLQLDTIPSFKNHCTTPHSLPSGIDDFDVVDSAVLVSFLQIVWYSCWNYIDLYV